MYPGERAAITPDKPAAIFEPSGTTLTYGELDEDSNRIAQVLYEAGLRPGDGIAFVMENQPLFLSIAWAAQRSGLFYTAISTALTTDEVAYIVDDCDAKVFICSDTYAGTAGRIGDATPQVEHWFSTGGPIEGFESLEKAMADASPAPLDEQIEGADMLYSSGTTGRPKGIKPELEFEEVPNPHPLAALMMLVWGFEEDSVYLSPAPLYHAAPLRFGLNATRFGSTLVIMEKWDSRQVLDAIERHRVTHAQFVPTHFVRLLQLDEEVRAATDVSSLELVLHAAAPCPVEVKQRMLDWFGPIIHEYYGGTEGNGVTAVTPEAWISRPGTVGEALMGEPHILDEDGNELPPGEPGTIYFADGPDFAYHKDPEKTAAAHNDRGWSTMGDVGYLDEDGFLYLTDRKANMIISGGVNIYPQEAENALTLHPAVFDVAVIGVPNPDFGEEVKAVVQLRDGFEPSAELEQDLIAYCRERLSAIKCPRSVDFRDELPRTATGKMMKRLVRDEYWQEVSS